MYDSDLLLTEIIREQAETARLAHEYADARRQAKADELAGNIQTHAKLGFRGRRFRPLLRFTHGG